MSCSPWKRTSGDFAATLVAVEDALVGGHTHYPFRVERREIEDRVIGGISVVQRYVFRILRSDGVLLDIERPPASRGIPG